MILLPNTPLLAMTPILVGGRGRRKRGTPKDGPGKFWSKLAQWFQRRLKCEKFTTDGRWTPNGSNRSIDQ